MPLFARLVEMIQFISKSLQHLPRLSEELASKLQILVREIEPTAIVTVD